MTTFNQPAWLRAEDRQRYTESRVSLPVILAHSPDFLFPGILRFISVPSGQSAKGNQMCCKCSDCLHKKNRLSGLKPVFNCFLHTPDCVLKRCISYVSPLCQTSVNGSKTPHKKKLWNSLELSNTLIVENVTVDHTGEYTCTASSGQMEKSASTFLKVYGMCTENICGCH